MSTSKHEEEVRASFKNRAYVYLHMYDELVAELGPDKAKEIMKKAIFKRGVEVGSSFQKYAPGDMKGLCDAFVGGSPADGALFCPEIERCDEGGIDLTFKRCPLKEAWLEAGLPEEKVALLCDIAAVVDYGTFEGNGFAFSADTYKPGADGCCHLHIRPGK